MVGRHGTADARIMANPRLLRGRVSRAGYYYAITTVVASRRTVFANAQLASSVESELKQAGNSGQIRNIAWMLMPDHLHWIFQLQEGSLGRCMQAFKSKSARTVNKLTGKSGPLWQPGYYEHRLRNEDDLLTQTRYVLENPVRKSIVARLEDYPWWWRAWVTNSAGL